MWWLEEGCLTEHIVAQCWSSVMPVIELVVVVMLVMVGTVHYFGGWERVAHRKREVATGASSHCHRTAIRVLASKAF